MGKFIDNKDKENVFNSSFTFLDRMNSWIERAHLYSADDIDIMDAFMALEEWSCEIDPLLTSEEQVELETLRVKTKKELLVLTKKGVELYVLREHFRPFQIFLGRLTQSKGLLMKQEEKYDSKKDNTT